MHAKGQGGEPHLRRGQMELAVVKRQLVDHHEGLAGVAGLYWIGGLLGIRPVPPGLRHEDDVLGLSERSERILSRSVREDL
eukprot:scaffold977_cov253-Pinguiococcus_pyrenoidosus.AAC.32